MEALFTPEGQALNAIKDLTLDASVARGVEILHNELVGITLPYAGLLNIPGNTVPDQLRSDGEPVFQ
ncbi:hypothetical protein [Mycobacterium simiae]|uniref:hypothetical protein n=1 Tax=Mycobacterium simiae TaxID=1784 RepID=UPI00165F29FB|nr:hypothetical protein [Mycobacterium simiae]